MYLHVESHERPRDDSPFPLVAEQQPLEIVSYKFIKITCLVLPLWAVFSHGPCLFSLSSAEGSQFSVNLERARSELSVRMRGSTWAAKRFIWLQRIQPSLCDCGTHSTCVGTVSAEPLRRNRGSHCKRRAVVGPVLGGDRTVGASADFSSPTGNLPTRHRAGGLYALIFLFYFT